jgi:hypothetical protein
VNRLEALAELKYQKLRNHIWGNPSIPAKVRSCPTCHSANGISNPDFMCKAGRFLYYEWDRAERRAAERKVSVVADGK